MHLPYLGAATGTALADAILGVTSPAGRLAASWYTRAGLDAIGGIQEYRMRPEGTYPGRTYLWTDPALVQFPFGFGLSYATLAYAGAAATPAVAAPCDAVAVTVTVTNSAAFDADEVVQVYATLADATVPTPRRALVAFTRVRVPARGGIDVNLTITPRARSVLREGDLARVVEPGRVDLWVGGCSDASKAPGAATAFAVVGQTTDIDRCEGFD